MIAFVRVVNQRRRTRFLISQLWCWDIMPRPDGHVCYAVQIEVKENGERNSDWRIC
jgi:hypothetical protein